MTQLNYSYDDVPTVREFAKSDSFLRGLMGPFGSGKSAGGGPIEIVSRAQRQKVGSDGYRRSRWAIVRNTKPMLRQTSIKTWLDWLPEPAWGVYNRQDMEFKLEFDNVKAEILFLGLDRDVDVKRLLSLELTGAVVDEAREVPASIINGLSGRVGRYPNATSGGCTWHGLWLLTNPPDDSSYYYKWAEEQRPRNARFFKQPSGLSSKAENINNLPPDYYTNIAIGKDEDWIKVYVHGDYGYIQDGKPVFPQFSHKIHVSGDADPIKGIPVIIGYDWGLTPCALLMQSLPNGQVIVFDELTCVNTGAKAMAELLLHRWSTTYSYALKLGSMWGDPAGAQRGQADEVTCFQVVNKIFEPYHIFVQPGEQTLELRLESVRWALTNLIDGNPAITIHPRCKTLIKALAGRYKFKKIQVGGIEDRYTQTPDKNHPWSDIADALQYPLSRIYGGVLVGGDTHPAYRGEEDDEEYGVIAPTGVSKYTGY